MKSRLSEKQDIKELSRDKDYVLRILPLTSFLTLLAAFYFWTDRYANIKSICSKPESGQPCLKWHLYLWVEIGILLPSLLNHLLRCISIGGATQAPTLRYVGKDGPRIDIFITCAGEDTDSVCDTIYAACASDYPRDRFRVIVLDDGRSEELERAVNVIRKEDDNLYYASRPKTKNHHYKAGNLNYGLEYVKSLPGGPAEYIAALDADMIPSSIWLRALLPHLLRKKVVALVTSPQRFYDTPMNDPLLQGLEVNYKVIEPLKHAAGAAWCGGSGYMVLRAALEEIGGFPTDSIGEDMNTSNVLIGNGWQHVYADETLQHGQVPDSYKAHVKQQTRWHIGRVQTAISMKLYIRTVDSQYMNFRQRFTGLIYAIISLSSIPTTIGLLGIPIVFFLDGPLIAYSSIPDLRRLLQLAFIFLCSEWIDNCLIAVKTGYAVAMLESQASLWMSPYIAIGLVRAFILPTWAGGNEAGFVSSGSVCEELNERDAQLRAPLFPDRLYHLFWNSSIGIHVCYVILVGIGAIHAFSQALSSSNKIDASSNVKMANVLPIKLLVYLGWPPVLWYIAIISCSVPIQYALLPPTVPNREQLLKRDPARRAAYPVHQLKISSAKTWGYLVSRELHYSLCNVYAGLLSAWTYWMVE